MKSSNVETSDEQLLSLLNDQQSREQGFRLLLTNYQERLYWHIRRIVTEHDDANDVLQNTCIKIYKNIGSFEGNSKLYTWLYRIATNEALTFLKKNKKKPTHSLDNEDSGIGQNLKADSYFDGEQAQQLLNDALETLPDKQKLVFNMRYFDEMSYADISEALGTSVGALKASYHHAVKKIESHFRATGMI